MMRLKTNGSINKNEKISKGYRLKVSTHNKIKELQIAVNSNQDTVIGRALKLYSKKISGKLIIQNKIQE